MAVKQKAISVKAWCANFELFIIIEHRDDEIRCCIRNCPIQDCPNLQAARRLNR